MATLNNYTFSDVTYTITEGTNVPGAIGVATLTIYPKAGYTIDVSDFSLNPSFSDPNVSNVNFAQNGNNIDITITFDSGFVMPADNASVNLCIIGAGVRNLITINGAITALVGSNISVGSSETDTPYSNSGVAGETELLFTRTYTADTNYTLSPAPTCVVTSGNQSNYYIEQIPVYDGGGNLTSITFNVNYIYPNQNISNDKITIKVAGAVAQYLPTPKITGYIFDNSNLYNPAETRLFTLLGVAGTVATVTFNDGVTTTTIINALPIPANGRLATNIDFPELTLGDPDVVYTITITGDGSGTMVQPNPIIVNQIDEKELTITSSTTAPITGFTTITRLFKPLTKSPYLLPADSLGTWLLEFDYNLKASTGTIDTIKQLELSDFSNTSVILGIVNGNQTTTTTLVLDDTTGILAGDKFNNFINDPNIDPTLAPFTYEVVSVDSGTNLTVTPAITVVDDAELTFVRNEGTSISIISGEVSNLSSTMIRIKAKIAVLAYGDADINFDLDLDNLISTGAALTPFDMSDSDPSSSNVCSDTTWIHTVYSSNNEFVYAGGKVYTDAALTIPFVGNNEYYHINASPDISVKITPSGDIGDVISICTI